MATCTAVVNADGERCGALGKCPFNACSRLHCGAVRAAVDPAAVCSTHPQQQGPQKLRSVSSGRKVLWTAPIPPTADQLLHPPGQVASSPRGLRRAQRDSAGFGWLPRARSQRAVEEGSAPLDRAAADEVAVLMALERRKWQAQWSEERQLLLGRIRALETSANSARGPPVRPPPTGPLTTSGSLPIPYSAQHYEQPHPQAHPSLSHGSLPETRESPPRQTRQILPHHRDGRPPAPNASPVTFPLAEAPIPPSKRHLLLQLDQISACLLQDPKYFVWRPTMGFPRLQNSLTQYPQSFVSVEGSPLNLGRERTLVPAVFHRDDAVAPTDQPQ
eukprot:gene2969-3541_t